MAAVAVASYQRHQRHHGSSSIGIILVASWQQHQRHHISGIRGIMAATASEASWQQQHHINSGGITAVAMASCMSALAADGRISIEMGVGYHNNGTSVTVAVS